MTNTKPTYFITQAITIAFRRPIPGRFNIYEDRDGKQEFLFSISSKNNPHLLNEILKRGIPYNEAVEIFREIVAAT